MIDVAALISTVSILHMTVQPHSTGKTYSGIHGNETYAA